MQQLEDGPRERGLVAVERVVEHGVGDGEQGAEVLLLLLEGLLGLAAHRVGEVPQVLVAGGAVPDRAGANPLVVEEDLEAAVGVVDHEGVLVHADAVHALQGGRDGVGAAAEAVGQHGVAAAALQVEVAEQPPAKRDGERQGVNRMR